MTQMEQKFYEEIIKREELDKLQQDFILADIQYGIPQEYIKQYAKKKYCLQQMKLLSSCFRTNFNKGILNILLNEAYNEFQMIEIVKGTKAGLSYEQIKNYADVNINAYNMCKKRESLINEMAKATENRQENNILLDTIITQISSLKNVFEMSIKALQEEQLKEKEEELNALYINLTNKDKQISFLQKDIQEKAKEIEQLRLKEEKSTNTVNNTQEGDEKGIQDLNNTTINKQEQLEENLQLPKQHADYVLTIAHEGKKDFIPIEETNKSKNGMLEKIFELMFKKQKKRIDLLKIVAEKQLEEKQLEQIRVGLAKGVTDNQVMKILKQNHTAEQMRALMEIAVLQNILWT